MTEGIVVLTGEVGSYVEKWKGEQTAERVEAVRGIANDVVVRGAAERSDTDIAKAAVKGEAPLDVKRVTVRASGGEVTLRGSVRSWVER